MGGIVHVMGPKEEPLPDVWGETFCSRDQPWDGDPETEVVFHEDAYMVGNDEWACPCGVDTRGGRGVFVVPLVH
jgi:hypothetical protein